jgi:DNA adenine methylase
MSYPGSKAGAGVWQRIIGQMPPHSVYVEPFFGSGYVFWRKQPAQSSIVIDRVPDLLAKAGAMPGVSSYCGDALELLPALTAALPADAVIYCDPPYPLSTRNGRRYYDHELTEEQHGALLRLLSGLECRVMISGYPCPLYSSQLRNWRCLRYKLRTRGKTVIECLWCNFDEPNVLHDWRYAGKNFRERLWLKRLVKRWQAKLNGMPARKRGYLLNAIAQRQDPLL